MAHTTKWTKRFHIGTIDRRGIFLSAPTWDCEWYWSFGYLGNSQCHYHLDGLGDRYTNMRDALKEHFGHTLKIEDSKLWKFCELAATAYALKKTAEVLGRGGSHYTTNPCADIVRNKSEVDRINTVVLPAIFDQIAVLLGVE